MKTSSKTLFALLAAIALAPSITQAQQGSRLCGYVAIETPTKIGLLFEARDDNPNYSKKCDEAIDKTWGEITNNPQFKAMNWKKIKKVQCEEVGNMGFVNKGQNPDICDNMGGNNSYKVMKQGSANATYEKQ